MGRWVPGNGQVGLSLRGQGEVWGVGCGEDLQGRVRARGGGGGALPL